MCISKTCWRTLQVTKIPQNCKMHSKSNNREKSKFILIYLFSYVAEYVIFSHTSHFTTIVPQGEGLMLVSIPVSSLLIFPVPTTSISAPKPHPTSSLMIISHHILFHSWASWSSHNFSVTFLSMIFHFYPLLSLFKPLFSLPAYVLTLTILSDFVTSASCVPEA